MEDFVGYVSVSATICLNILKFVISFGILWFIVSGYLSYQKKRWDSWQKLAENNNLTFIPGTILVGAQVRGSYLGHRINLETSKRNYSGTGVSYTIISVITSKSKSDIVTSLTNENIIELFESNKIGEGLWERVNVNLEGREITYEKTGIVTDIEQLQFLLNWVCKVADAYSAIVALGGEIVPYLHKTARYNTRLKPLFTHLLHIIAQETTTRLGERTSHLYCLYCVTCCGEHKIQLNWHESITYYGCRICGQSREFYKDVTIIAILDNNSQKELHRNDNVLRVNWLVQRRLFDFDSIEIKQATDEDVERFAIQVGNDTDLRRKPQYKHMKCLIYQNCNLSENTIRIIRQMFGEVGFVEMQKEELRLLEKKAI